MTTETKAPAYRAPYAGCPLCGGAGTELLGEADCRSHPLWHPPLAPSLRWLHCRSCRHVFTDTFYTEEGLQELFRQANPTQVAGGDPELQRMIWSPVVERVLRWLPERTGIFSENPARWVDVGCGAGGLLFTAAEYGFAATGLDLREDAVRALRDLGYQALRADLLAVEGEASLEVLSMADVLEHMPYPVGALRQAHRLLAQGGVLFVSCPNRDSSSWRTMDRAGANPYWSEIEHYHNFSRSSLVWLLRRCGFEPVQYAVSARYKASMEIIAIRAGQAAASPVC